jgi:NTP pyrophosphatase (non-canonical NTP hydrolase)
MTLSDYQKQAATTCLPSADHPLYMVLALMAELGEVAERFERVVEPGPHSRVGRFSRQKELLHLIAVLGEHCGLEQKRLRDEPTSGDRGLLSLGKDDYPALLKELGDCLWNLSGLCRSIGFGLDDVALANLAKLKGRMERGVIGGSGDNR